MFSSRSAKVFIVLFCLAMLVEVGVLVSQVGTSERITPTRPFVSAPILGADELATPHVSTSSGAIPALPTVVGGYVVQKIWDYDFKQPRALAVDRYDNVYVGESYQGEGTHSRILKFDSGGTLLGWWGKGSKTSGWHGASTTEAHIGNGSAPGEFNYVFKIAFDERDNMYVIDRGSYYDKGGTSYVVGAERIVQFDNRGAYVASFDGVHGWQTSVQLATNSPVTDFAIAESSCIVISGDKLLLGSWKKNRIDTYDLATGKPTGWLGKSSDGLYGWHSDGASAPAPYYGTEVGAFNGIIDCNLYGDELYVTSYNSNPVVAVFAYKSGEYLRGISHSEGHKPQEIIVDQFGNLIFSDNYEGSIKFLHDMRVTAKMQLGPGTGNYFGVGDFAFNSDGKLYFTEGPTQKVYELKLEYK